MTTSTERRIALFIDFENLVTNTGITAPTFNLQPALDRLLEKGKVIFRRAYCDWSRFKDAKAHLHEFGVELVDVPPSTRAGKNSADMRLVIDALELCYAREHINTFVIASGDSDFCPLAYKLRENDRFVIGLAVREATSPFFVKACDEFIYLRGQERGDGRDQYRDSARATSRSRPETPVTVISGDGGPRKTRALPAIAREVVSSLLSRATGPLNPSLIKETIVRKEPDFDERDHGFSTFSRLLEAMEKEGMLKRQQQGRQWYVVPADGSLDSRSGHDAGAEDEPSPQRVEEEFSF
ncbi:MAG TPA: NYN domain-containing protein [Polyangia bacterium]|nr:NYN domain-containing protein [Polyangia bacterium]